MFWLDRIIIHSHTYYQIMLLETYINNTSSDIHYNYLMAQLSILLIVAYSILFKQYTPLYTANMDFHCMFVSMYDCHQTYNFSFCNKLMVNISQIMQFVGKQNKIFLSEFVDIIISSLVYYRIMLNIWLFRIFHNDATIC